MGKSLSEAFAFRQCATPSGVLLRNEIHKNIIPIYMYKSGRMLYNTYNEEKDFVLTVAV